MAERCALYLCTALAIAAAASSADGVGQSQGQQVSDDRRPELVDWPHFGQTQKEFLVSDRLEVETSTGNSNGPVKSSSIQVSSDFKRPQQMIEKRPYKEEKGRGWRTTTSTVRPYRLHWADDLHKQAATYSFYVERPDDKMQTMLEMEPKGTGKEVKTMAKRKRSKPKSEPKPKRKITPWRKIKRTAVEETEAFRIRDVNVPSGLQE